MLDITAIDPNFKVKSTIKEADIRFYDVLQSPFSVHGIFYQDGKFRRIPEAVAETVNKGVLNRHANTAGGRIRFKTDSAYVAIHAEMENICRLPHFNMVGAAGFDLYIGPEGGDCRCVGSFIPEYDITDGFEGILRFPDAQLREITINMPLYSDVKKLYIGLQDGAKVDPPEAYKHPGPIVYYGSSITQGGCATRPGNSYENFIARRLSVDYVNLGFSGNAKGEPEIADYVSKMDMSTFVYDYDFNAHAVEYLQATHERMYLTVRQGHPDIPIVILSRPNPYLTEVEVRRREIIRTTYLNAKARGENVYFISGEDLMRYAGDSGLIDGVHPNDLGFASMARVLGDLLETIL